MNSNLPPEVSELDTHINPPAYPADELTEQEFFFYENAGYSYDPKTETEQQGRIRCAKMLAQAETYIKMYDHYFEWEIDPDIDSSEWDDDPEPWATWQCLLYVDSELAVSLRGIDFGRDGHPDSDPHGRVIQAELAAEHLSHAE